MYADAGFGFAAAYSPAPPFDFATAPAAPPPPQGACIPVPMDDTYASMPLIADTSEIAAAHLVSSVIGSRFLHVPPFLSRSCLLISIPGPGKISDQFQFTVLFRRKMHRRRFRPPPKSLFLLLFDIDSLLGRIDCLLVILYA
jgi:hypothetical protein